MFFSCPATYLANRKASSKLPSEGKSNEGSKPKLSQTCSWLWASEAGASEARASEARASEARAGEARAGEARASEARASEAPGERW